MKECVCGSILGVYPCTCRRSPRRRREYTLPRQITSPREAIEYAKERMAEEGIDWPLDAEGCITREPLEVDLKIIVTWRRKLAAL